MSNYRNGDTIGSRFWMATLHLVGGIYRVELERFLPGPEAPLVPFTTVEVPNLRAVHSLLALLSGTQLTAEHVNACHANVMAYERQEKVREQMAADAHRRMVESIQNRAALQR